MGGAHVLPYLSSRTLPPDTHMYSALGSLRVSRKGVLELYDVCGHQYSEDLSVGGQWLKWPSCPVHKTALR